ncbi:unnamed protein product, partial [Mycena citricolor]
RTRESWSSFSRVSWIDPPGGFPSFTRTWLITHVYAKSISVRHSFQWGTLQKASPICGGCVFPISFQPWLCEIGFATGVSCGIFDGFIPTQQLSLSWTLRACACVMKCQRPIGSQRSQRDIETELPDLGHGKGEEAWRSESCVVLELGWTAPGLIKLLSMTSNHK